MMALAARPSRASSFIGSLRAARCAVMVATQHPQESGEDYTQRCLGDRTSWGVAAMSLFEEHPADERTAGADGAPPVVQAAERVADQLDSLVPISEEVGNQVLVDNARLVRWTAPLFAGCALLLLPWILIAGLTLPQRQLSRNF